MKYLVTGGAGFLGSHLCKALLLNGNTVLALDNLSTGSKDNIRELVMHPKFEFIEHDVEVPVDFIVDGIFNLACPASPVQYQLNSIKTLKTNFLGSLNMLELAKKLKIPVLQASTSEVYGDPKYSPQSEEYWGNVNPIGIRSCYDEGKRVAESLFFDYQRQHKVDIKVARIFNTYGPNMALNDGRIISNFVTQALQGQALTIYGDGSQTRSFCYVDDLIKGLILLMKSQNVVGPINLGNSREISIFEIANKIIEATESASPIVFHDLPQDDPSQRCPDTRKAKALLNWEARIELEEGLRMTIDYFKEKLKA
jgi:UDP-glucuronate decarboxylase